VSTKNSNRQWGL